MSTYLRRAYSSFATHILDIPPRLLALLFLLLLLAFPLTKPRSTYLIILTAANMGAIFAASWDLLVGRCGQMNLGHALFFGTGAYITALLNFHLGWPIGVTIPLAVLTTVAIAVLVGFPSLRVKGPYLALVTMALPLIATGIVFYFKDWTGGERPLSGLDHFFSFLPYEQWFIAQYYFTLLLLVVSGIIIYKIANSHKIGVIFVSILDDELSSRASGINTTKYKLMAFALSALFASLAGAISAHLAHLRSTDIGMLSLTTTFLAVIMTIFGGVGTIYGPIAGAFILQFLQRYVLVEVVEVETHWQMIIFLGLIVVLIIKWPRGIAKFTTDKLEDLAEERPIEERGKHIWKRERKKKSSHEG